MCVFVFLFSKSYTLSQLLFPGRCVLVFFDSPVPSIQGLSVYFGNFESNGAWERVLGRGGADLHVFASRVGCLPRGAAHHAECSLRLGSRSFLAYVCYILCPPALVTQRNPKAVWAPASPGSLCCSGPTPGLGLSSRSGDPGTPFSGPTHLLGILHGLIS